MTPDIRWRNIGVAGAIVLTSFVVAAHPATAASKVSTKTLLAKLTVAAEHTSGYARSLFKLWDSQGGGCDTRDEVLITEATIAPHVSSTCTLTGGRWRSPYDGVTTTNPSTFDIDHLVPLAEAWRSGAYKWTAKTREVYANDLGYAPDLVAVTAHANRSKGDDEPSSYLPPKKSFDCTYEAWWVAVKWRWHLSINTAEKSWLHRHLRRCRWPTVSKPTRPAIGSGGGPGGSSRSGARISAVHFDSSGADNGSNASRNAEWVRVKNTTTTAKTMTGWRLQDASSHSYTFPAYTLAAGNTVKIHTGSGNDTGRDLYWGESEYVWNNSGDTAKLRNSHSTVVDTCTYTSSADPEVHC